MNRNVLGLKTLVKCKHVCVCICILRDLVTIAIVYILFLVFEITGNANMPMRKAKTYIENYPYRRKALFIIDIDGMYAVFIIDIDDTLFISSVSKYSKFDSYVPKIGRLLIAWLYGMYGSYITFATLHYTTLHYIMLHYITIHHITSHHITSHHIRTNHITTHHITSHHITLHYITSHIW